MNLVICGGASNYPKDNYSFNFLQSVFDTPIYPNGMKWAITYFTKYPLSNGGGFDARHQLQQHH
jgi:hypothetical protein